jgi:hypothetical protein
LLEASVTIDKPDFQTVLADYLFQVSDLAGQAARDMASAEPLGMIVTHTMMMFATQAHKYLGDIVLTLNPQQLAAERQPPEDQAGPS